MRRTVPVGLIILLTAGIAWAAVGFTGHLDALQTEVASRDAALSGELDGDQKKAKRAYGASLKIFAKGSDSLAGDIKMSVKVTGKLRRITAVDTALAGIAGTALDGLAGDVGAALAAVQMKIDEAPLGKKRDRAQKKLDKATDQLAASAGETDLKKRGKGIGKAEKKGRKADKAADKAMKAGPGKRDPVDLIVNAVNRASHGDHWHLDYPYEDSDWSFFANGKGACRMTLTNPAGRTFTWTKTGPRSLQILGPAEIDLKTWTEIDGSVEQGTFTMKVNNLDPIFTLTLRAGTILTPTGPAAGEVFTTDPGSTAIRVRDKVSFAELRSISGGNTLLSQPTGIAVDVGRQEIFVANSGSDSINVYDLTASGNTPPLRQIAGASTGLAFSGSGPGQAFNGIFVDSVNGEIGVVNDAGVPSITIYDIAASGDAAPLRTIQGPATTLNYPSAICVDTANDEILVSSLPAAAYAVVVFGRTADGDASPQRTLTLGSTWSRPFGLGVDPANGELWISGPRSGLQSGLEVYARTASGLATPLRGIRTNIGSFLGLALDTANGEVGVVGGVWGQGQVVLAETSAVSIIDTAQVSVTAVGIAFGP
ncbi:MAG: NHL repeat-containing protein [Planctomycetota bacterium]|jgi:DNA-binding beta-propeller fold protein YncE